MHLTPAQKSTRQCAQLEKIESLPDPATKEQKSRLSDFYDTHFDYLAHLLRTKHQSDYYKFALKNLKPGECVVVINYKMKLEIGKCYV